MSDKVLIAIGFARGNDGALRAPAGSQVTLNPVGAHFYELVITAGNSVVTTVVHETAIKTRERAKEGDRLRREEAQR